MPIGDSLIERSPTKPHVVTPGREVTSEYQTGFSGGLNITSVDDELGETQFRRSENCRQLPFGAIAKRGGTQRTAAQLAAGQPVRNGFVWYHADGTRETYAACNGKLFVTTYGSFPLTWTLLGTSAISTTVSPVFAVFIAGGVETLYIADGGRLCRLFGTNFARLGAAAVVSAIAVHNERLWGVGDPAKPQSLWYSALNEGNTLGDGPNGGGEIIVRTFGDQALVGLASLATSLLIFHTRGISRLTGFGQDDIAVQPAGISQDIGTLAAKSIVIVNNVCYFVSDRGLYVATEQGVQPVATPTQPDPLSRVLPEMSATELAEIRACYHRATRELLVWVPLKGIYVYHTILNAWCGPWIDGYLAPATRSLFEGANTNGYPIVLVGDDSGYVLEVDRPLIGLDNVNSDGTGGDRINMALQARRFYCQDPHTAKAWRYARVLASMSGSDAAQLGFHTDSSSGGAQFDFSSASEWGNPATTWGDPHSVWGGAGQVSQEFQLDGYGYSIDLTISDSSISRPIISQMGVVGFLLGRR